jgi:hypothetical protein
VSGPQTSARYRCSLCGQPCWDRIRCSVCRKLDERKYGRGDIALQGGKWVPSDGIMRWLLDAVTM